MTRANGSAKNAHYSGPTKPVVLPVAPEGVPVALQDRLQWVTWNLERRGDDWSKLPYSPAGALAKSNEPTTWGTLDAALADLQRRRFSGIGFMFAADDPFVGIDLDDVRDPETEELTAVAQEIIARLNTYADVSPSGTGVKLIGIGKLPDGKGRKSKDGMIEVYDRLRYFAITGQRLPGCPAEPQQCQAALEDLLRHRVSPPKPSPEPTRLAATPSGLDRQRLMDRARKYIAKMDPAISGERGHDRTFSVAMKLVEGFALTDDEVLELLREYSDRCQPPWSERDLRHKVESARARIDAGRLGHLAATCGYSAPHGSPPRVVGVAPRHGDKPGHPLPDRQQVHSPTCRGPCPRAIRQEISAHRRSI
jgi:hypothetical protein